MLGAGVEVFDAVHMNYLSTTDFIAGTEGFFQNAIEKITAFLSFLKQLFMKLVDKVLYMISRIEPKLNKYKTMFSSTKKDTLEVTKDYMTATDDEFNKCVEFLKEHFVNDSLNANINLDNLATSVDNALDTVPSYNPQTKVTKGSTVAVNTAMNMVEKTLSIVRMGPQIKDALRKTTSTMNEFQKKIEQLNKEHKEGSVADELGKQILQSAMGFLQNFQKYWQDMFKLYSAITTNVLEVCSSLKPTE